MKYLKLVSLCILATLTFVSVAHAQLRVVGTSMHVDGGMRVVGDVDNAGTHTVQVSTNGVMNVDGNYTAAGNPTYGVDNELQISGNLINNTNNELVFAEAAGVGGLVTLDGGAQNFDGDNSIFIDAELALVNGSGITKTQFVDVRATRLSLNDCELQTQTNTATVVSDAQTVPDRKRRLGIEPAHGLFDALDG